MMINDPSHICGRRDILLDVAQKAIDLDYDGLMIESTLILTRHGAMQSSRLLPNVWLKCLINIGWRKEDVASEEYHAALEKLRQQINHLDDELMQILSTAYEDGRKNRPV